MDVSGVRPVGFGRMVEVLVALLRGFGAVVDKVERCRKRGGGIRDLW